MGISKVVRKNTGEVLVDLTNDTVTAETLMSGVTAHDKNGDVITGVLTSDFSGSSEPITTEYTYTYDGDYNNENISYVYNYGGIKVFAKLGDIPEGTLNLVGASLFRTNPKNEWLNKRFTITEEHLEKTLNKASTDIPASQDGLIQIYDII